MSSNNRPKSITSLKLKITVVLILILSAVSATVFSVINLSYLEENYLYANGAPTTILPILAITSVALAVIGTSFVKKSDYSVKELPSDRTSMIYMLSLFFVALFLAIFVLYVMHGAFDIGYGISIKGNADLMEKLETATLFYQIMIILSPIAPIYFLVMSFKRKTSSFFGTLTLLWILAYILRTYFDITDWVMSPRKLSMLCAMCFAALFILYEVRFSFARGNIRRYFFMSAITTVFCFSAGLTGVISSVLGVYPSSFEIPYYGVAFALGLYAAIRLCSIAFAVSEKEVNAENQINNESYKSEKSEENEENENGAKGTENV
ncbi:MAG: hypothetical protein E7633_04035 [Ruminococcaceae bacterium]|nr:hypothetical protein [Oscillospiraceae bacterium]